MFGPANHTCLTSQWIVAPTNHTCLTNQLMVAPANHTCLTSQWIVSPAYHTCQLLTASHTCHLLEDFSYLPPGLISSLNCQKLNCAEIAKPAKL